jgi:hypothetical protein
MNAWMRGVVFLTLALASLVGLGGGTQPPATASPQQVDEKATATRKADTAPLLARLSPNWRGGMEDTSTSLRQTYEDIEIYRRLLTKSLSHYSANVQLPGAAPFYSGQYEYFANSYKQNEKSNGQGQNDPHAHLEFNKLNVSGVYLPPAGMVFTADIPGKLTLPSAGKMETGSKPLTEWDRTRRELRGEKLEAPAASAPRKQPHVLESVLHSLAENGQHLSGLTPDQNVSVVLTFRNNWIQQCQQCHTNTFAATTDTFTFGSPGVPVTTGNLYYRALPNLAESQPPISPPGSGFQGTVNPNQAPEQFNRQFGGETSNPAQNDQAILGDLRFKQGHYTEAAAAYSKSLQELGIGGEDAWAMNPSRSSPKSRAVILRIIELQNRIVQCEAALKHEEKVSQGVANLKRWMAMLERIDTGEGSKSSSSTKAKATGASLPDKLIVTASKSLLDQIAKQQISFDEFKAKVKVEFVRFD